MNQQSPFCRYISCLGCALELSSHFSLPRRLPRAKVAITGRVADSSGAVLQGARVELQPRGITAHHECIG